MLSVQTHVAAETNGKTSKEEHAKELPPRPARSLALSSLIEIEPPVDKNFADEIPGIAG